MSLFTRSIVQPPGDHGAPPGGRARPLGRGDAGDGRAFVRRRSGSGRVGRAGLLAIATLLLPTAPARAEADRVRVSRGFGTAYLPLMVMQDRGLIEKHARDRGLGPLAVEWKALDGGNNINDAMLAGSLDIAGIGVPGFILLWSRTRANASAAVIGLSALSVSPLWLNTNKPSVRSLRDLGPADRIAVPGIKTSSAAFALQMAVAKEFGVENFAKLDPLTVSLPHPDALTALTSGRSEITAHFASPPFSYRELRNPAIHRVLSTKDAVGPLTLLMNVASRRFADANPKLVDAFLAAQSEANALIARDTDAAADIYERVSGVRMGRADLIELLKDPDNTYSIVPCGMMEYAAFMRKAGLIKTAPASWSEMFIPALHGERGS